MRCAGSKQYRIIAQGSNKLRNLTAIKVEFQATWYLCLGEGRKNANVDRRNPWRRLETHTRAYKIEQTFRGCLKYIIDNETWDKLSNNHGNKGRILCVQFVKLEWKGYAN